MIDSLRMVSDCEKDNICESVYVDCIYKTYDFLLSCESFAGLLGNSIPDTCYTNFRDSLFHFWKMNHSFEIREIEKQAFAVREHSNRAKTDATISLFQESLFILGNILDQILPSNDFDSEKKQKLIMIHDKISNAEMHLRLSGMMLGDEGFFRMSDDQILDLFEELLNVFEGDLTKEFLGQVKKNANGIEHVSDD